MFFNRTNQPAANESIPPISATPALVDTSVIIDGRIADIARAGFAPGKLLIPRFVLAELQLIADSGDAMKRGRGRRGLEMLHGMRESGVDMEIVEYDYDDIKEVDAKLVRLGRQLQCNVLTTDYNLNRVASIEGVRVLNINELANAVRPVILPGERMHTKIVQSGKEKGQGVGYLADGTMIVVDGGEKLTGQDVEVEITRVFQTVAGKMLFAALAGAGAGAAAQQGPQHERDTKVSRDDGRPSAAGTSLQRTQSARNVRSKNQPGTDNRRSQRPTPNSTAFVRQEKTVTSNGQNTPKTPGRGARRTSDSRTQEAADNSRASSQRQSNQRRSKRVSPTQRLENSLVELTGGDQTQNND